MAVLDGLVTAVPGTCLGLLASGCWALGVVVCCLGFRVEGSGLSSLASRFEDLGYLCAAPVAP